MEWLQRLLISANCCSDDVAKSKKQCWSAYRGNFSLDMDWLVQFLSTSCSVITPCHDSSSQCHRSGITMSLVQPKARHCLMTEPKFWMRKGFVMCMLIARGHFPVGSSKNFPSRVSRTNSLQWMFSPAPLTIKLIAFARTFVLVNRNAINF